MTEILIFIFVMCCFSIIGWGLMKKERMIQFPFLAAGVFLGWVLPQLVGLIDQPDLPRGGLNKTIIMSILCLAAAWWGYNSNKKPAVLFQWKFNRQYLLWGAGVLSLVGAFFFYQVSLIASVVTIETEGAWSGIITIYAFFSKLLSVGFAIALILFLSKPSWSSLVIILFDLIFYMDRIVIKGRRAFMVELGLMLLLALWFQRRWLPPRWFIVILLVIGSLVINSIGNYRSVMLAQDHTTWSGAGLSKILEIDFIGNFKSITSGDRGRSELNNAVMLIEATDRKQSFDYGLSLWNYFVHSYVPGQFFGYDFKRSLMFNLGDPAYEEFSYIGIRGSTTTGISDSFMSFWYFGAIKFFIIGFVMSRWYRAAIQGGFVAQMILLLVVTASLHGITHFTHWFFIAFIQFAVFAMPVLMLARVGQRQPGNNFKIN